MKTLIRKELRENVALMVLGLIVFSLLLALGYREYANVMREVVFGSTNVRGSMQPVTNPDFLIFTALFCGIFAAVMGWFQAYRERHRDLWSFLVHRPMTRTQIFLGKVGAGLALYAAAAGLPLLVFLGWAITPGHVAAPFEWRMLWPVLIFLVAGAVSYFAGMLTCLRQARWYASRGLPLAAALVVTITAAVVPHPWQAMFLVLLGGFVLGISAWASFRTNGFYHGQPGVGQLALPAALTVGTIAVVLCVLGLLTIVCPSWVLNNFSWSWYQMTKDGTIYKLTSTNPGPTTIADLEGHVLRDPKTRRPLDLSEMGDRMAQNAYLQNGGQRNPLYVETSRLAPVFRITPQTLWFFWPRYGRLVAFDAPSRRAIGSLGPNGFTSDLAGSGQGFSYSPGEYPKPPLHTASKVYLTDLEKRTSTAIFNSVSEDPILDTAGVRIGEHGEYDVAVLTRRFVRLLTSEGKPVWELPYQTGDTDSAEIRVWMLQPPGNFALWVTTGRQSTTTGSIEQPIEVTWIADGHAIRTRELPNPQPAHPLQLQDKLLGATLPPVVLGLEPLFTVEPSSIGYRSTWRLVRLGLVCAAVICVPIGWWLGRRYSLSLAARLGWSAFLLATGIPGLLAFLSAQEWPAREPCPKCGRKRIVEREQCEHCGASFAPPEQLGIEIFEPEAKETVAAE